jgi:hypothetical protein
VIFVLHSRDYAVADYDWIRENPFDSYWGEWTLLPMEKDFESWLEFKTWVQQLNEDRKKMQASAGRSLYFRNYL